MSSKILIPPLTWTQSLKDLCDQVFLLAGSNQALDSNYFFKSKIAQTSKCDGILILAGSNQVFQHFFFFSANHISLNLLPFLCLLMNSAKILGFSAIWVDFSRKWKLALLQTKWWSIKKLGACFVLLRRPIKDTLQRLQIKVCTTARSEVVPSSLDFFIRFALFFLGQLQNVLATGIGRKWHFILAF